MTAGRRLSLFAAASIVGLFLLIAGLFFVAPAAAVEPICPGGSSPRADIVWCADFDNLGLCATGSELLCWLANGFPIVPPFQEDSKPEQWRWHITSAPSPAGGAAVGTGYIKISGQPGGVSGYHNYNQDPFAPGPGLYDKFNLRFYRRMSKGRLRWSGGGHGPGVYAIDAGHTCLSILKFQNALDLRTFYPIPCGSTSFQIPPNKLNLPAMYNNRWYLIEMHAEMDTSCTNAADPHGCNGVYRLWIDEQLVAEYTDMNFGGTCCGLKWKSVDIPTDYYHFLIPPWQGEIAFDNVVWSGNGTYIGPAANENPRGTADTTSPYIGYDGMDAVIGHRTASDCDYTHPGYLGVMATSKYRSGATIQNAITHGAYDGLTYCTTTVAALPVFNSNYEFPANTLYIVTDSSNGTCTSGGGSQRVTCRSTAAGAAGSGTWVPTTATDAAMQVSLTTASAGGGVGWFTSFAFPAPNQLWTPSSQSIHGFIYLPSNNNYGAITNLALAGFVDGLNGDGYVALSINGGKWSIRQRANGGTPQTAATSPTTVTFDTWHEFELILWSDTTLSVMIDRQWLFTKQSLPLSASYMFATDANRIASLIVGVIDFQGAPPFTAYYDDLNAGSVSFWSCVGWGAASCPFSASRVPAAPSGLVVR